MIACRPLAPQQGGPHVQRQDCDAETPGGEGRNRGSLGPAPLRAPAGSGPWLRLRPETGARRPAPASGAQPARGGERAGQVHREEVQPPGSASVTATPRRQKLKDRLLKPRQGLSSL